ncbi:hypothetical protein LXA43DRAFT_903694 [Ganoderma leucocontextum]|nr:hypothetical protein LXA43DRAFT_903694 [Ganoderma leucocontextum]
MVGPGRRRARRSQWTQRTRASPSRSLARGKSLVSETIAPRVLRVKRQRHVEKMRKSWDSIIYAFYEAVPEVKYIDNRRVHSFKCANRGCSRHINRYLDTKDATSTSNMRRHAQSCWGADIIKAAEAALNIDEVRENIVQSILTTGTITSHFERKKGAVTYRNRPHTTAETRAEIAKWVLMKTGRPNYYIPSPSTVARDVKQIFARTRTRIAKMLQEYDGKLNYETDTWTSPNHRAFVAFTVHFEWKGETICLPLDVVEVACSHTGVQLADAFAEMLEDFGIERKVRRTFCSAMFVYGELME